MSKTAEPLISIIVPVYNAERYLRFCINSILTQSYTRLQVILVDDGAKDSSPQICDEYARADSRVEVIHQANGGIAKAQNAGLDAAQGEFIAFADNDDILDKRNIELLYHALESTGADMSKAGWQQFGVSQLNQIADQASQGVEDPSKVTVFNNPLQAYQTVFCKSLRLLGNAFGKNTEARYFNEANWCRLYRRTLWNNLRFPEGMYAQDTAIASELYSRMGKIVDMNCTLYYWLQQPNSVTHKKQDMLFYHDHIEAALRNMDVCKRNNILPARSFYTLVGNAKYEREVFSTDPTPENEKTLRQDQEKTKAILDTMPLVNRLHCSILRRIRLVEKFIYDRKVKNLS